MTRSFLCNRLLWFDVIPSRKKQLGNPFPSASGHLREQTGPGGERVRFQSTPSPAAAQPGCLAPGAACLACCSRDSLETNESFTRIKRLPIHPQPT
jgi:hypothetical protein